MLLCIPVVENRILGFFSECTDFLWISTFSLNGKTFLWVYTISTDIKNFSKYQKVSLNIQFYLNVINFPLDIIKLILTVKLWVLHYISSHKLEGGSKREGNVISS